MNLSTPTISRQNRPATGWLLVAMLLFVAVVRSWGAAPIYQNFQSTTNWPSIDAVVFDNRGVYHDILTTFPADMTDTLTFLNHGDMNGEVGFRFDTVTATNRKCALAFTNYESGTVQGLDSPLLFFGIVSGSGGQVLFTQQSTLASYCLVNATNIANRGLLSVGNVGLLRLNGKNVDLARGLLAAGDVADLNTNALNSSATFFNLIDQTTGRGFIVGNSFVAPPHVYDLFWGATAAGSVDSATLAAQDFGFGILAQSPIENVQFRGGVSGALTIPINSFGGFDAKAYITPGIPNKAGNEYYINVIFYKTNSNDPNVLVDAEFTPFFFNQAGNNRNLFASLGIVQFGVRTTDILTGSTVTNAFYLLDSGAFQNPINLDTNVVSPNGYARPTAFEITTATPFEWFAIDTNEFGNNFFNRGLIPYDSTLIYPGSVGGDLNQGLYENQTVTYTSGTYGAQVGRNPEFLDGLTRETNFFFTDVTGLLKLPDVTNDIPRIEINATNLDMTSASLRTEGLLTVNTKHLNGGGLAAVDVGSLTGDIASTNGFLQISNVVPPDFKRVRGNVYAWSGSWDNLGTNSTQTNRIHIHVLIVDHTLQSSFKPTFNSMALRGTTTVVQDNLRVIRKATFDADSLTFNSRVELAQSAMDFASANAPHLKDFLIDTNGQFLVEGTAYIGFDRAKGLNTFINHGFISATAPLIKATYVQNTGTIVATNGGSMFIQGDTVDLIVGPETANLVPTNTLVADRDIEIDAATVNVTNSTIIAGRNGIIGKLTLDVSDSLSDFVPNIAGTNNVLNNYWQVNDGISIPQKPNGDLFGTEIVCLASNRNQSQVIWPGEDVGAGSDGFNNNLAVGHFVLDRQTPGSSIRFSAAGNQNAIYIDYLELRDFSFDDYRNGLVIDPDMTVYFAASNFEPDKLQAVYPGRLVWANSFTGPNSTKAVARRDGSICLMNRSLAESFIIDLDNDGIVNANDPFPLDNDSNPGFSLPCPGDSLTTSLRTFITDNKGSGPVTSLAVSVTGSGKVTPQQKSPTVQLGKSYNLRAVANGGNLFAGWSGSINTTQPSISFTLTSNMVLTARFVTNPFIALKGSFNGLFYDTNVVTMDSAGSVTFSVSQLGGFSGHLGMNTAPSVPFGGQFDADGNATVVITRGKKPSLTMTLKLDTTGPSQQITGTIACDTNWTANLIADRAVFDGRHPAPFTGNYTFALPGTNDPSVGPAGDSYGTPYINRVGILSSLNHLADGNSILQVVTVSKDGNWPLFLSLFGREMVIGWVHVDSNGGMSGTLNWIKNASAFGNYRAGFSNTVTLTGSSWTAPKNRTSGLNLTNPVITLSGGNLVSDLTPTISFNPNTLTFGSTSPQLSLKLVPSTGLINGWFKDPTAGRVRQLNGVMLRSQNNARGFFLGADQSGAVRLDNP